MEIQCFSYGLNLIVLYCSTPNTIDYYRNLIENYDLHHKKQFLFLVLCRGDELDLMDGKEKDGHFHDLIGKNHSNPKYIFYEGCWLLLRCESRRFEAIEYRNL